MRTRRLRTTFCSDSSTCSGSEPARTEHFGRHQRAAAARLAHFSTLHMSEESTAPEVDMGEPAASHGAPPSASSLGVEKSHHALKPIAWWRPTFPVLAHSPGGAAHGDRAAAEAPSVPATKRGRGRPAGVLKCAKCSKKSRPCGPGCPGWQALQPGASATCSTATAAASSGSHGAAIDQAASTSAGGPNALASERLEARRSGLKCRVCVRENAPPTLCLVAIRPRCPEI